MPKIVYRPHVYEELQHVKTGVCTCSGLDEATETSVVSLHSDVYLMQHLDEIAIDSQSREKLAAALSIPIPNNPLGETLSKCSDDELLDSCTSPRFFQTLSEKQSYLEALMNDSDELAEKVKKDKSSLTDDDKRYIDTISALYDKFHQSDSED